MPSKYDTNPLDPEFPEKARAAAAAADEGGPTQVLGQGMSPTRQFPSVFPTEEQTRRFVDDPTPFGSAYHPPYAPLNFRARMHLQDPSIARSPASTSRKTF